MRRFAFLFVLAAGVAVGAEKKEDKKADPADGTWVVTGIEIGGVKVPEEELKKMPSSITLAGEKWTLKFGDMVTTGTSKVDKTKTPITIDSTTLDGPEKGKTMLGIVEVKGDSMKACFDGAGKKRPKEFSSKDEPTFIVIEYKREKK